MAPPTTSKFDPAAFDALLESTLLLADDDGAGAAAGDRFPEHVLPPRVAQARVRAMRATDAPPRVNLASFVTTAIEPECAEVVEEARAVNEIDAEEYPSTDAMRSQQLLWLSDLWHAPPLAPGEMPAGADTVGSSEGVLLAGAAAKRRWQERRRAAGLPTDRPNIVMPTDCHVVWEKLSNYFEIEPKWVPARKGEPMSRVEDLADAADENTVLLVAILGSTFSGAYYDVARLDALVREKNAAHPDWHLGIHVDAASGGFLAPFASPELEWDFRLGSVVSIQASGHKFGQCLAGIGWVLFRSPAHLPRSLVFADAYLGSAQTTLTLNFSKGAGPLVNSMYMFTRLGRAGYKALAEHMYRNASKLREAILGLGHFAVLSDPPPLGVPAVVFHLVDRADGRARRYTEYDVAERVRLSGFVVPAYPLAPDNEERLVLRVLTRQDFTGALRVALVHALASAVDWLESHHPLDDGAAAPAAGSGAGEALPDEGAVAKAASEAAAAKALPAAIAAAQQSQGAADARPAHVHAATHPARLLAATRLGLRLNHRGKC